MEAATAACGKKPERRSTRSSTSKNRFSSRNTRSEAFYAGAEPLSVRRALHNSAGPDPDTNSAPNSSGSAERARRHQASGRARNLDPGAGLDVGPRAERLANQEVFHTVPRDLAVSRKDILRRYSKDEKDGGARFSEALRHRWRRTADVDKDQERPKTLPSIAKRSQREPGRVAQAPQGFRKISRQDILRRRASVDAPVGGSRGRSRVEETLESSEAKGGTSSSFSRSVPRPRIGRWGREVERESRSVCDFLAVASKLQDVTSGLVPRPSTLPKILHASRESRFAEDWASPRLAKDAVRKEPPVYGRIRRRKTSLPTNTGTPRSSQSSLNTLTRYSRPGNTLVRERAVDVEFRTTTRHLRDPVPDAPYQSATLPLVDMRGSPQRNALYAKVSRKTSKSLQRYDNKADPKDGGDGRHEVRVDSGHRTMSRRRIIDNMKGENAYEEQNSSRTEDSADYRSESQSYQGKDFDAHENRNLCEVDSDRLKEPSALSRGNGSNSMEYRSDGNWTKSREATKYRSKSQSRLIDNYRVNQREACAANRLATTLPSYVKSSRKCSNERPPGTECHRKLSKETGISSKQSKERSNYVKKSAASHVKAFNDANSARSNSPVTTSSIFGFCTGKRKVQSPSASARKDESAASYPTWNVRTGELVWFDPGVGHVLPGEVLEYHRAANVLSVQAVIAGKPQIFTLTNLSGVKPRQDLGQNGVEDMIQLTDLNEASLLWNLKIRYDKELIYTYTGSILVAVNPYKMFDIYGLDQVKLYEGRILGTLPPHLFAVGSSAYSQVTAANNASANQVVVISGESGSGKTESTKLVMQYLAAVNRAPNNLVTEQILEATPLLESFGNAKTPRNDNSSRFGKYLEVYFRDGVIVGGRITQYLLEKSRIVTQASEERNYHVFYELLAGLDQQLRDKYGLLTPDKYFYLNQGGNCEIDGKSDVQDFKALLSAMQVLGFTSEEQDTIFKILASVLHLGNVYFHRKQMRHGQEGVEVGSDAEIRWAAHLLQVNSDGIIRALTTKTTEARNERVFTALNIDQALDARDAFAKALYSSLFSWLVARVNHIVYKGTKQTAAISILDIFGFENFAENSLEQLCINYANENLQFYFNKHIFKLEQQEYAKEKIDWTTINYTDNLPVIHLIAKKPVGILHLLDDESNFPKASDLSFLEKCHYNHALSELYSRPRMNSAEFAIKHYAGQVWYNVEGFLDKNRDTLRPDVVELLISSKISMVSKMFQHVRTTHEANKTMNKPNGRFVTMKPRTPTVSARFHDSLQQLLDSMSQCNPWFVRCIKPNTEKAPMKFDMPCVLEQLRYTGMLETIRIRKTGYPVRLLFGHFVDRYRYLVSTHLPRGAPNKELCRIILDKAASKEAQSQYQLGLTRVFLRESLERTLEYNRALILERAAITVQRYTRGFLARRRFLNISRSTVLIQAVYRGYRERKKFRATKRGALMAQKMYRGKKQREKFKVLKEEMTKRAEIERASKERAKAKQQREEQERTSRAVAGVNHLEIPAELAFIYSKLDDWQPTHTERNLLKVVGQVIPVHYNYSLPPDIDQHQFSKFTNIYFKSHIFGMKREPIKTPFLTKARDQDYTDSLMIFKMILRFMNENNLSGKREQALGDYIVNKGIVNEKLRDEILCQLANQTWKNENDANKERGWLLLSNCLSAFQPSPTLFKYFLKYVSDHAYDGYKAYCQRKLLQGERTIFRIMSNNQQIVHHVPRNYPPCVLEWRANRNRVNMALSVGFYDGETVTCAVDSWTTCEELANLAVHNHGVDNSGWTITLWNQLDGPDAIVTETNGFDYVLDLISEMELAPAFPAAKHMFLEQRKNSFPPIKKREHTQIIRELEQEIEPPVLKTFQPLERKPVPKVVDKPVEPEIQSPRRPAVPPPQPPVAKPSVRKQSHEAILETTAATGLSRKSALNDRYFEREKQRSRSLDNLLQPEVVLPPVKLANLGLSSSKLNERYHSLERIGETSAVSNVEYMTRSEITQERKYSRITRSTEPNIEEEDLTIDFEYPDIQSVSQTGRSEDDKNSYIRSQTRFIKSQYPGKRALPGSQSSRAYIEKSEYGVKSSAMSDTSEAPSLASHVRRVRVPSQASDVDQFLDELFMPVLDGNLDELSDARSLAASIKGTGDHRGQGDGVLLDTLKARVVDRARTDATSVENVRDFMKLMFSGCQDEPISATELSRKIKGGGTIDTPDRQTTIYDTIQDDEPGIENVQDFMELMFSGSQDEAISATELSRKIKGGGNMDIPNQNTTFNFGAITPGMMSPPMMMPMFSASQQVPPPQSTSMNMGAGFMPIPIYSMQGLSLPQYPNSPPSQNNDMMAYQQNLQRAFLQSAMAQNIQIQQQLLAQNQALQQLLVQSPNSGQQPGTALSAGPSSMNLVPPAPQNGAQMGPNDSIGRYSKVSFREPEDGELWSTEKQGAPVQSSTASQRQEVTVKAQIHRSQSPPRKNSEIVRKTSVEYAVRKVSVDRKVADKKVTGPADPKRSSSNKNNVQSNFTNVLSELKNRKSSVDSNLSNSSNNKGVPPPPPMPPPLESHDPSESRPFLDPYGRAKTVRIGKWRWPPPSDSNENQSQDSFIEFKMRQQQQQRKITPQFGEYNQGDGEPSTEGAVEWEEFEIENIVGNDERTVVTHTPVPAAKHENGYKEEGEKKKKKSKSALEVGAQRPSPGSIGKLKLSSEMRQRLEKVTANHSVRSTKTAEKPALPRDDDKVKRLEDNRKLLLEQQLGGRWDDYASTADDTQSVTSKGTTDMMTQAQVVRTQIERMERPVPPPLPVTPPQPPSPRGGSMYSNSQSSVPQPRSPPAPIEPKTRDTFRASPDSETFDHFAKAQRDMFSHSRDIFASQQHLREAHEYRNDFDKARSQDQKSKDFYSKDSTDMASSARDRSSDFDSRRDLNSDIFDPKYARDIFENSSSKRDPFGMTRDVSPKSRDSFGMPSSRDFGVMPNTRESFAVARQSFKKMDREVDRRSSVASTHRTDKMERIEIEEWPEFLRPVLPPADKPEIEKVQEVMNTKLYPQTSTAHFTYNRVTWTLRVKKEVFAPNETLNSPLALHLVFCQVAYDVLATSSIRITKEDRQNMLKMLDNYGVTLDNLQSTQHKITIKKNVVDMAKQWPLYFARIFPVSIGPQHPETQHVAVSHHGLRLVKRTPQGDLVILETLPLEDIVSVSSPRAGVCVMQIASGVRLPLHTNRAPQLTEMISNYIRLVDQKPLHKSNHHENHVSQITKSIQSQANHGSLNHVQSHGQSNHVISNHENHVPASRVPNHVSATNQTNHQKNQQNQRLSPNQEWRQPEDNGRLQEDGIYESGPVVNDGKHSLLQYAMLNFRQSTEKFEMLKTADGSISGSLKVIESLKSKKKSKKSKGQQDGAEWTWKEQVDLVKYSPVPIEQSLLRLDADLSGLAVECFLCLMRYMGDQPLPPDTSEVKCVYTILMHCHKYEQLRDEVYCQLMKQTTNNKSPNPDSCQRGWRIFSIVAAYFTCSDGLRPYLTKYLETAAYDKRRAYHGTATVCLQNLRKTVKYGGRKNVPSVDEIMAISAGRNAKRQIYRLPGGTERVINTKCTTVVQDVIEEMCNIISVRHPHEMDEFSLYCIVDGDAFTMPLARDEYVLDVTTELHKNHQVFYLIFCRSVWYYPLRLDAPLYIEVVFNQIAPDYLEGLLLVLPGDHLPQEVVYDMAQIAALLHRAADMTHEPTTKEIKYLLPKPVLSLREPRPQQWSNMVQQAWNNVQHNTVAACKAQVLEILWKWPLFGSSFFAVKRVPEGKEKGGDHILALNRHGVHFIDLITHETLHHYPYSEVISTRKVKSEEGTLYLDMKCGNLMQQRITRLQTEQAHEISRLIRQYITMEQRATNNQATGIGFGMR
ncbi:unconventional myosin 10A isoform X1 [Megalopta genalis]|uniref:unconventional myosin 10A isoform X1 n=1 Tax=Megalopta genalis TaxID=115081 RepID=UPI003FCFE6D4